MDNKNQLRQCSACLQMTVNRHFITLFNITFLCVDDQCSVVDFNEEKLLI